MKSFVFCICMGYNGKVWTISFMLKIILLQHKIGVCLHGHIYIYIYREREREREKYRLVGMSRLARSRPPIIYFELT